MGIDLAASASAKASGLPPLRVMVVDDSAVIRGLIGRWIEAESDMVVVASSRTGLDAVHQITRADPDAIILDIEMPDMDGISALPQLLAKKPGVIVIMASTLTLRNAEVSLKALSLGASDYIAKPETKRDAHGADAFRHELVQKIRHLCERVVRRHRPTPSLVPAAAPVASPPKVTLVPFHKVRPQALVIGSSTGGPQALTELASELTPVVDKVPVLITQHMPPPFTTVLATHLSRASGRPASEGVDGQIVRAGNIYVAPGGFHMRVARQNGNVVIKLDNGPQINFCRPAVDPLFMSAVEVWHADLLGLVLTGMGSDGMRGGKSIVAAGGNVIAQDEATSVVWGMPGAAAHAGICAALMPLNQIGKKVQKIVSGDFS